MDLTNKKSEFLTNGKAALQATAAEIEGMVDTASDAISSGYKMARTELKRVNSQTEKFIKENPLLVTLTAVGIGWIVGRYLVSRSEEN